MKFACSSNYYCVVLVVIFYYPHSFYFYFWNSSGKEDLYLSPYLLIHLYQHGFMNICFFSLGCNPVLCFVVQSLSTFVIWHLCSFDICLFFFFWLSSFLLSGTPRCSSLILCFLCLSPRIIHFSKKPWFLLLEKNI